MPMKNPQHPGEIIREDVIGALGLSVTRAAQILGVGRPALSAVLNARAALTPAMALRVEKAFEPKMDHLLRMQCSYDVAQARKRAARIKVARYYTPPRVTA
jgi:addiction module HigA family antidote